jgi:hypothetical protein
MRPVWNTKFGKRRVRQEAPTLDEAIFAARGISDDPQQQAEIAAALMDVPVDEVRIALLRSAQRKDVERVMFTKRAGGVERAVVVERKTPRRAGVTRTFRV